MATNERLTLATFFHGNGWVSPKKAVQCVEIYNEHAQKGKHRQWKTKFFKFEQLFPYLDRALDRNDESYHRLSKKYYYYSMMTKHMMYYNGEKRKNAKLQKFVQHEY